jgi:hypothetical protein
MLVPRPEPRLDRRRARTGRNENLCPDRNHSGQTGLMTRVSHGLTKIPLWHKTFGLLVVAAISIPAGSASAITVVSPRDGTVLRPGGAVHFEWILDQGERGARFYIATKQDLTSANWTTPQGDGSKIHTETDAIADVPVDGTFVVGTYFWRLCVFHTGQPDSECAFTSTRRLVIAPALKRMAKPRRRASNGYKPAVPQAFALSLQEGERAVARHAAAVAPEEDTSSLFECGRVRNHGPGWIYGGIACGVKIEDASGEVYCVALYEAVREHSRIEIYTHGKTKCENRRTGATD